MLGRNTDSQTLLSGRMGAAEWVHSTIADEDGCYRPCVGRCIFAGLLANWRVSPDDTT